MRGPKPHPRRLKLHPKHPSWSFYACVVGIIFGSVVFTTIQPPFANIIYFTLAILLLLIAIFRTNHVTIALAFIAGIIFASCRIAPETADRAYLNNFTGQTITISGTVVADPNTTSSGIVVHLTNLKYLTNSEPSANLEQSTQETIPLRGTLYVQFAKFAIDEGTLLRSDTLTITGKLGDAFGTFSGTMFRPEIVAIERPSPGDLANQFKIFFASKVREHIPSPAVDLGLGYLVGDKTGLSEDFSEALRLVGMTHVVVASGAHLGILIGLVKKLFGKISKFAGLLFSLLAIFAFALVVGFTASMTRAALVASLSLLVGYVGRQFTPLRLILFVAALTLLISPNNLLNLGWQLSFASFFGILVLAPRLAKFLYGGKKPSFLASMLITSFATTIICAPLLIYSFGTFSLLSFAANLVILPTLPYAMLLVFLTGATSFFSPLAALFSTFATLLLNFHIDLVNFLSTKTTLIFELPASDPRIFLVYIPVLAVLLLPRIKKTCYNKLHGKPILPKKSRLPNLQED